MDKKIVNIVTIANILEFSQAVVTRVGFDYQAPLDEATIGELISNVINNDIKKNSDIPQGDIGK